VNFAFTDEQEELRRTVRKFLESRSPMSETRRLMETDEGYDDVVWKQMAQELALQGIHVPEEYGGQGFSFVELGIVLHELGRTLLPAPYFSTVCLAANVILNAGTEEQKRELLPALANGEKTATLALAEPNGRWDATGIEATATADGDVFTIDGTKSYVLDGHTASLVIVAAREPGTEGEDGVGLFVIEGDADGLTRTKLETIDRTRKQAKLAFEGVRGTRLGQAGWHAIELSLQQAAICLAAESAGGAERCLEMAVEYAKSRVQFGKPIGAFQAIKHMCADMLLDVESAKTATYFGLWAASTGDEDELRIAAPLAKSFCSEAFFRCATSNHQVHGGIGFTWEHDAHLFFRRAKTSELLFGDPPYHRERLADRLGI
jgi:alkylation response protein AidB-like acyl-CoA dehydrogenase